MEELYGTRKVNPSNTDREPFNDGVSPNGPFDTIVVGDSGISVKRYPQEIANDIANSMTAGFLDGWDAAKEESNRLSKSTCLMIYTLLKAGMVEQVYTTLEKVLGNHGVLDEIQKPNNQSNQDQDERGKHE